MSFYSDSGGKGDPAIAQEKAVQLMLEKLEVVSQMFHGFAYEEYFEADTRKKFSLILAAEEHILGLENGKKRYINEVTALSQAFSIAIPHEQAMDVKDEVSFFQAIKSRLAKFDGTGSGKTDEEIETAIKQVIDKALVTELAIVLFERVKANASIDWTIKESVKAKLKVIVKSTLRQYGYPPDMQKFATETVLKQAELIAEEITRGE